MVQPGCAEQFAAEWAANVKPLRESAGFVISGAWVIPNQDKFIWILGWPGPGTLADADSQYYGSEGRSSMDPDPARLIVVAEEIDSVIDALHL